MLNIQAVVSLRALLRTITKQLHSLDNINLSACHIMRKLKTSLSNHSKHNRNAKPNASL